MARVQFDPRELDQNVQLEDGVRSTLEQDTVAEVAVSVIETCYEIRDEDEYAVPSTLEERCSELAHLVGADYQIRGAEVWFRRKR